MRVLQFSAGFQLGDAISQEMLELKRLLHAQGYNSEIFSENINKSDKSYASKFHKANIQEDDFIVYHHSIHSEVLTHILKHKNKKILIYHNVTPHHFFEPYDLKFSYLLKEGRNDLSLIRENFHGFLAVSEFNREELLENGMAPVELMPLHLNFKKWEEAPFSQKRKDILQFLFVGRLAPNKRQDDLIRFAKIWKEKSKLPFQLKLIGFSNPNQQSYLDELTFMIRAYELQDNIEILSYVNEGILSKFYRESDYFISMSEHEGFCVPLLEAMYFSLPVIAFKAGAVEETLGGTGKLFSEKNFEKLTDLILELEGNQSAKSELIEKQQVRLSSYIYSNSIKPLLNYLK